MGYKEIDNDLITKDFTHININEDSIEYNAPHHYEILRVPDNQVLAGILFQKGPVKEAGVNGIFMEDLIAICIDRLESFQKSNFSCRENAVAITKLEESLMWLRKRTLNRQKRNVEGKYEK